MTSDIRVRFSINFVIGIYPRFGIGTELAVSVLSEAAALEMAGTDSAVHQFGAHVKARKTPAQKISVIYAVSQFHDRFHPRTRPLAVCPSATDASSAE